MQLTWVNLHCNGKGSWYCQVVEIVPDLGAWVVAVIIIAKRRLMIDVIVAADHVEMHFVCPTNSIVRKHTKSITTDVELQREYIRYRNRHNTTNVYMLCIAVVVWRTYGVVHILTNQDYGFRELQNKF